MSVAEHLVRPRASRRNSSAVLVRIARSPRFWIYLASAAAAVLINYVLGREMLWDTLDYHLYAGFSALHDRFGRDYFAAGTQSYFNPYVYVPFYLLATSGLSALAAASILAILQSGILWLTYELTLVVAPLEKPRARSGMAICAVLLALLNPILLNQFGSSSSDITTAELVLLGWLLVLRATRAPGGTAILFGGLLLGATTGLKLTNSVHLLSAAGVLLFIPVSWRSRFRRAAGYFLASGVGFLIVAAPWAIQLERHFGNPLFPLLNGIFHSPDFFTSPVHDLRFVPDSLGEALWRPFAISAPVRLVDDEFAAPDLRYATLLLLLVLVGAGWLWRRLRGSSGAEVPAGRASSMRPLAGLCCAFLIDWTLWLVASGNGRYFTAMACCAAVLVVALLCQISSARPKARNYAFALLIGAQVIEACAGATYRENGPWGNGAWFEVSMPSSLRNDHRLYFEFGEQTNSFLIPHLDRSSGVVDLDGDYVLGANGANGNHIRSLIREYWPNLGVLVPLVESRGTDAYSGTDFSHVDDTLGHFGLRADAHQCSTITVRDVNAPWKRVLPGGLTGGDRPARSRIIKKAVPTELVELACRVVPAAGSDTSLSLAERRADTVFDRVERACPNLFQPAGPVTLDYGDQKHGFDWVRRYGNTNLSVVISGGIVRFIDPVRGGPAVYLGRESDWEKAPVPLVCWRLGERYHAALSTASR